MLVLPSRMPVLSCPTWLGAEGRRVWHRLVVWHSSWLLLLPVRRYLRSAPFKDEMVREVFDGRVDALRL